MTLLLPFLPKLFSILTGPVGIILVVFGAYLFGIHTGKEKAREVCEVEKARSIEINRTFDAAISRRQRELAERQLAEAAKRVEDINRRIDSYARLHTSCPIGDTGARFLNDDERVPEHQPQSAPAPAPSHRERRPLPADGWPRGYTR